MYIHIGHTFAPMAGFLLCFGIFLLYCILNYNNLLILSSVKGSVKKEALSLKGNTPPPLVKSKLKKKRRNNYQGFFFLLMTLIFCYCLYFFKYLFVVLLYNIVIQQFCYIFAFFKFCMSCSFLITVHHFT